MRAATLVVLPLLCCGTKSTPVDQGIVDVATLGDINQAAALDLHEWLDVKRSEASRCADPVRALVRQREPGFGRVGVVVRAVGVRGRSLVIQSVSVAPKFPGAFDECVKAALRGTAPTIASGDYALDVRLYLCVDPDPFHGSGAS